jgi:glutamate 5-kinase
LKPFLPWNEPHQILLNLLLSRDGIDIEYIQNDVTSIDELKPTSKGYEVNFSDNDILSVLVANAVEADLVIILSNVDGLYTTNPQKSGATLIKIVEKITPEIKSEVEGKSPLGRGGMKTKLRAAEIATSSGIPLIIANSQSENVLRDILAGKKIGTYFKPQEKIVVDKEMDCLWSFSERANIRKCI